MFYNFHIYTVNTIAYKYIETDINSKCIIYNENARFTHVNWHEIIYILTYTENKDSLNKFL